MNLRNDISFHGVLADDVRISADALSSNGTHWFCVEHVELSFFTDHPEEATAILVKLRTAIDTALADQVVPACLREAA